MISESKITFQQILGEFSDTIDNYIRKINNEALRIRVAHEKPGLFDFLLTVELADSIQERLGPEASLDDLIDMVFDTLWDRLDSNLARLQYYFRSDVFLTLRSMLSDLRTQASQLGVDTACPEFLTTVDSAHAALGAAITRIANWFRLSKSRQFVDFRLELAIAVAAESVRNCFGNISLGEEIRSPDLPMLEGRYLSGFVDVFFILFENACKHSGLLKNQAYVEVIPNGRSVNIVVSNPISALPDISVRQTQISAIRASLNSPISTRILAGEGGTGLYKIRKILEYDLGCLNSFDFEIRNEGFVVNMCIEVPAWL
jgi:hypothetical protein